MAENPDDLESGRDFQKHHQRREPGKSKNLCSAELTVRRMRRQTTNWENVTAQDIADQQLLYFASCNVHFPQVLEGK